MKTNPRTRKVTHSAFICACRTMVERAAEPSNIDEQRHNAAYQRQLSLSNTKSFFTDGLVKK